MSDWTRRIAVHCCGLALLVGCDVGTESDETDVESAERATVDFGSSLSLNVDGQAVDLPLDGMDIFLVEETDRYPENYVILGPGVHLGGAFPMDVHVGYGDKFDLLVGRAIPISPRGGDPREPADSSVTLPDGQAAKVTGGTFTVEKVGQGAEGKIALRGKVQLQLKTPAGARTVDGTFAVRATTWG